MNTKIIKLDINKNLYDILVAKQGDTKSRFLLFNLLDGSIPFSLENRSVRVYAIKPDKTEVFNDLIITDATKGYCVLELTTQMLAVSGTVKLELMVIEGDKKLTSNIFYMDVKESINSEKAVVSTNEFGSLLTALASLNEYDNYKNEIKNARGGQVNLKTRLDNFDEQLDTIVQNMSSITINAKYPPLGFLPIVSDGVTDNTSRLQSLIDFLEPKGGGKILLPIGTFLISSIDLVDRVVIEGVGRYSVLKSINNNSEAGLIKLKNQRVIFTTLKNFTIDGNKTNQSVFVDGVLINNQTAVNDAHHVFSDLYITSCSGNGINFSGQSRENRVLNCHVEKSALNGIKMVGTDNFISNCTCNNNGLYGYDLSSSYSNKLSICKAFANTKSGFNFNSSHNIQSSNLESQENGEHGYEINSCFSFIGSSLVADSNSVSLSLGFDGFNIKNSQYTNIQGIVSNNMLQGNGHRYAVRLEGENKNSFINLTGYSNTRPLKPYYEENKNITNIIYVNGVNYSLENKIKNNIYLDLDSNNISDIFTETYQHPTAITSNFLISRENSSQRLNISTSTSAGEWAYIGALNKFNVNNGKKISLFASVNRNGDNLAHKLSIIYYNSSDTKISEDKVYNDRNMVLTSVVPESTSYAKIMISLYPTEIGATGYLDIFNLSYGIY